MTEPWGEPARVRQYGPEIYTPGRGWRPLRTLELPAEPPVIWELVLDVVVFGIPQSQGNKTAVAIARKGADGQREFTGQASMIEGRRGPARAAFKSWREEVRAITHATWIEGHEARLPASGPLRLLVTFVPRERPASHPKRRETWPTARPDADKLLRAVADAMTHVPARTRTVRGKVKTVPAQPGVIVNDSAITDMAAAKRWPGQDPGPGMPATPTTPGAHIQLYRRVS